MKYIGLDNDWQEDVTPRAVWCEFIITVRFNIKNHTQYVTRIAKARNLISDTLVTVDDYEKVEFLKCSCRCC